MNYTKVRFPNRLCHHESASSNLSFQTPSHSQLPVLSCRPQPALSPTNRLFQSPQRALLPTVIRNPPHPPCHPEPNLPHSCHPERSEGSAFLCALFGRGTISKIPGSSRNIVPLFAFGLCRGGALARPSFFVKTTWVLGALESDSVWSRITHPY
jgi:hypothetical protein